MKRQFSIGQVFYSADEGGGGGAVNQETGETAKDAGTRDMEVDAMDATHAPGDANQPPEGEDAQVADQPGDGAGDPPPPYDDRGGMGIY